MLCYLCGLPGDKSGFYYFESPRDNSHQFICSCCWGNVVKGIVFYFCDRCTEIKGTHESSLIKHWDNFNSTNSNFCKECWDEIEQDRDDNEADRAYQREEVPCQS